MEKLPDERSKPWTALSVVTAPCDYLWVGQGGKEEVVQNFHILFYVTVHCLMFYIKNKLMYFFEN